MFACAALILASPVLAAPQRLFTFVPGPPAFNEVAVAGAVERYDVSLDPQLIAADPDVLELALPDGRLLEVPRELFLVNDSGLMSWVGTPHPAGTGPSGGDGYLHLVHHGDHVTGILNLGAERYRLVSLGPGLHQIVRLVEGPPACGLGAGAEASGAAWPPLAGSPQALEEAPAAPSAKGTSTEIDVLAVYTGGFSGAAENAVRDFIEDSVSIANTGFLRSQVSARYRLVHMAKLTGAQPPGNGLAASWQWINSEPTEIKNLRNAYGADMVALFVPLSFDDDNFCGIANVPQSNGNIAPPIPGLTVPGPFGQRAFTVHRNGCGINDFTFGHELGHNYGMRHPSMDMLPLFSFASGHRFSVNGVPKASMLQCIRVGGPITGAVCTRVNNFSNPNVILGGSPTGTSMIDNARVATLQKASYAAFRSPEVGSCTPTSTALCLLKNRFKVEIDFVNDGVILKARTKTFSDETGFFWFFSSGNLEVGVKLLDGRSFNNRFWVFHGAMTGLQYTVKVTDTIKGQVKTYLRPATSSSVICGGADFGTFAPLTLSPEAIDDGGDAGVLEFPGDAPTLPVKAACMPTSKRLCLLGNRFQVEVKRNGATQSGFELTDESGVFVFFSTTNGEVPVKVLDGRALNGKFWVYFGSMTETSYQVVVKDAVTGVTKTYTSPQAYCGRADFAAF